MNGRSHTNSDPSTAAPCTERRRVLLYGINYAPEPIGVGRYSGEIGAALARAGHAVEAVTAVPHYPGWSLPEGYRNRYLRETIDGVAVRRCPLLLTKRANGIRRAIAPLSFALTSAPVAFWRILRSRPDVVLCVEPSLVSAPVALLAAKLVGARRVLHVQDLEVDAAFVVHLQGRRWSWRAALAIERRILRAFDRIVTISHRMRDKIVEKGVPVERLAVVRNWVDLGRIYPQPHDNAFRRRFDIAEDVFVALYSGNVGPKQALPLILDAAAAMAERKDMVFVVAGSGPEKDALVERYGHLPNVRFIPLQPEESLCALLNMADVHLLPQHQGTADLVLPSKLGGMLASGKPSIVMADPGTEMHEFLGEAAILIPAGDVAALTRALGELVAGRVAVRADIQADRAKILDAASGLDAFMGVVLG